VGDVEDVKKYALQQIFFTTTGDIIVMMVVGGGWGKKEDGERKMDWSGLCRFFR